jgi:membrane-bound acyltransferase YfiQ involved in biofilm formation
MVWAIVFLTLAVGKTVLAFNGEAMIGNAVYPMITLMHKLTVLSGLIACWFGLDPIVKWCMARPWFVWLSAFSFIIYALHAPLVAYAINGMFTWLQPMEGYRLLTFFVLPLAILSLCILIGAMLRALTPKFYGLLTGGRGI